MQNIQTQIQIPVTNLQSPITLFHRILACFWVFGMVFLSFGIVNAQTATDRQNRSEVGLMTKPLEAASRWLINKQIKAVFGDIEAQAQLQTNDIINNAIQAAKYIWEKAWQTAILQAALKLISAIFKIISDFVNKLMDMISSIGNLNAVLAPFASTIVGVARNAYSKVVACADYWARRELQEVLPAIDTGAKTRECPWLNEEPKSTEELKNNITKTDSDDEFDKILTELKAKGGNGIPDIELNAIIEEASNAKIEAKNAQNQVNDCDPEDPKLNDPLLTRLIIGFENHCEFDKRQRLSQMKQQEVNKNIESKNNIQNTAEKAVDAEPGFRGENGNTLAILPLDEINKLNKSDKNDKLKKLPDWFNLKSPVKDIEKDLGKKDLGFVVVPYIEPISKKIDIAAIQGGNNPQPAGGVDEMFSNLTEQFTKMLNDLISNLIESVIFKIVDFIADSLLKAINSFLGPDSILGGLGLDSVAGNLVNTMRDGIKDSVSNIGSKVNSAARSISDPLAKDRQTNSDAAANFNCDGKIYWKNSRNYDTAKLANCQYTDSNFTNSWCKEYNGREEYNALIKSLMASVSVYMDGKLVEDVPIANMQGLIERTCSERSLPKFEFKPT